MSDSEHIPATTQTGNERILQDLLAATIEQVVSYLKGAHPVDGGTLLMRLPHERAAQAIESLDSPSNALLLREMHAASAAAVCELMDPARLADVLSEMAPDDRVDILHHLPTVFRDHVLPKLDSAEAEQVGRLASYPADSAGGIITTEAIALPESMSSEQAVAELRMIAREVEQVHYVYVTSASAPFVATLRRCHWARFYFMIAIAVLRGTVL